MSLVVRPVTPEDRAAWGDLYAAYAEFYGVDQTDTMRDRVWGWLHDPAESHSGLVAVVDGRVAGIAHFREFSRPLAASRGGYLDDLFVAPQARGTGAAEALIVGVADVGRARGWTVIRWITAAGNARARAVYDRLAQSTPWVTYDMPL